MKLLLVILNLKVKEVHNTFFDNFNKAKSSGALRVMPVYVMVSGIDALFEGRQC